MSRTVSELRNEIRQAVGRYERAESTAFTKEALAAICDDTGYEIDTDRLPPKSRMRVGILAAIDAVDETDPDGVERPFRKAELRSIAEAVQTE